MEKKYTIHFKSGNTLEITQEIMDIICFNSSIGSTDFQIFSNKSPNNPSKYYLLINLSEIDYIN